MNQRQLELQRDLYRLLLGVNDSVTRDIDEILYNALKLVVEITRARIGYIELRDKEGAIWWSKEHCNEVDIESIRRRISTGIISRAISTGETIITPSAFLDARFSDRDSVREDRIEAVLCSPFKQDEIVGVIYLQGESEHAFTDEHCLMETELFSRHITPLLRQLNRKMQPNRNEDLRKKYDLKDVIGDSHLLLLKLKEAMAIAELDVTVLLTGETGTGKGVVARAIHKNSFRKYNPFVHVNCANLPEQLAESELFGASKGSHSGAYTDIKGKIAAAKGGTLFLDEIGILPISIQSKLLQFLEDGCYCPLGSTVPLDADVRIITATNINFEEAVSQGTFKEDLYYRLCVFPIELPPLRKRKEDIPALVTFFIKKYCNLYKMAVMEIEPQVLLALQECEWKGNVREIDHKVQQGILRARVDHSSKLQFHHLLPEQQEIPDSGESTTYREGKDTWERRFLIVHLEKNGWNISETAKSLDLSRSHLNNLIKIHQLERRDISPATA
ncbi:MAG: sigma 54-interacting transcriptional regulator [Chitinispirillaceae bacterium]|nr:sigma 54-interacting transcriptional regulator [Chitinispirillaceae bacterium]